MAPQLYWQIHSLSFQLEKRIDEALKDELNLGFAQYKVLEAVHQNELTKQNVVARLLNQTEASVSRQTKILEKKGLIHVNVVMGNKRARELSITRVGYDIIRQSTEIMERVQADMFGALRPEEQRLFYQLLSRALEVQRTN